MEDFFADEIRIVKNTFDGTELVLEDDWPNAAFQDVASDILLKSGVLHRDADKSKIHISGTLGNTTISPSFLGICLAAGFGFVQSWKQIHSQRRLRRFIVPLRLSAWHLCRESNGLIAAYQFYEALWFQLTSCWRHSELVVSASKLCCTTFTWRALQILRKFRISNGAT